MNLKEALCLPILKVSKLLTDPDIAGDREISWVSVIEVPVDEFIRSGEFVLSTGMNVGHDANLLARFVSDVAGAKASALALAIGPYTPSVPNQVVKTANRTRLPLIELPWETRFSEISEVILKRLIQDQAAMRSRDDFVWSLANGNVTDESAAAQWKHFNFNRNLRYVGIVGRMLRSMDQPSGSMQTFVRSAEALCADLARQHQLEWLGTTADDSIVGYLQVPRTTQRIRSLLMTVQERAKRKCVSAWGIGRLCHELADFKRSFEDASIAGEIGLRARGEGSVTDVSDVLADRVLLRLQEDADVLALLNRYIEPLRQASRVPLLSTLETFFENDCNASETARKLSISRQSLINRLSKAESLLNTDLRVPEHRFAIALSLRIHKLQCGTTEVKHQPL